jgi:hypothetical protein
MSTSSLVRKPTFFPSSLLVAAGLVVGFAVAQGTGIRALGGVLLIGTGLAAARLWVRRRGWLAAVSLGLVYLAAFVLAHVLALGLGVPAWLSVAVVTIAAAGVTYWVADRPRDERTATTVGRSSVRRPLTPDGRTSAPNPERF